MTSQQAPAAAKVCCPCTHFEHGAFADDADVLARRIMRYPLTGDDVRVAGAEMISDATAADDSPYLIVHVENGRAMVRLSVTGAYH
jgi:hypothetical protein